MMYASAAKQAGAGVWDMDNPQSLASTQPSGGRRPLPAQWLARSLQPALPMMLAMLLCCLLCAICGSCRKSDAQSGAGQADGRLVLAADESAALEQPTDNGLKLSEGPATHDEIEALWNGFSIAEQALLEQYMLGLDNLLENRYGDELRDMRTRTGRILQTAGQLELQPAGRPLGQDLHWQKELDWQAPHEGNGLIVAGNLDEDPQSELFLGGDACRILELDGSLRTLEPALFADYTLNGSWDYDGDGRLELLGSVHLGEREIAANVHYQSVVLSLEGKEFGRFEDGLFLQGKRTADLEGDGQPELVLRQIGKGRGGGDLLLALEQNGQVAWSGSTGVGVLYDNSGDIDGDGREELIGFCRQSATGERYASGGGRLLALGMSGTEMELGFVQDPFEADTFPVCFDVNADGSADVLIGNAVYDTRSRHSIPLEKPQGWPELFPRRFLGYAVLQYEGQACLAFLATSNHLELHSDTLLIWGQDGKLLHQESFGEELLQLIAVPAGENSRLAISSSSGLLISEEFK
jgi:hypothetical protein